MDGGNPLPVHTVCDQGAILVPSAVYRVLELVSHDLETPLQTVSIRNTWCSFSLAPWATMQISLTWLVFHAANLKAVF